MSLLEQDDAEVRGARALLGREASELLEHSEAESSDPQPSRLRRASALAAFVLAAVLLAGLAGQRLRGSQEYARSGQAVALSADYDPAAASRNALQVSGNASAASSRTLFCFLVATVASHGEVDLVRSQYRNQTGIFQCDDAQPYADEALELQPGKKGSPRFISHSITHYRSSLSSKGWMKNTNVFLKVWDMLIQDGRFQKHDCTVKVDPDTVFLPTRLRAQLGDHAPQDPWYFANCAQWQSMQGPIEVVSRAGVQKFAAAKSACQQKYSGGSFRQVFGSQPGEDMLMDVCLHDAGVAKVPNWELLADENCGFDPQSGCASVERPAYHMYKWPELWSRCLQETLDGH